jgi:formamidopyrimidine-DNA glycosylase
MPELPEVENVKLSLESLGTTGQVFDHVELRRANLRTPLKKDLIKKLPGQMVKRIYRRAKFLLFETEDHLIVNHLGMTGSWREPESTEFQKHDHVVFYFRSGFRLVFNDPRRFGLLELANRGVDNKWLKHLAVEPFDAAFTGAYLFKQTRGIKAPIKNLIMDQRRVVGVGNIYASEALFLTGVKPTRRAERLTAREAERLAETIRAVLTRAIAAGGSTIRDYRNSQGESGRFQQQFAVYGRKGEECVNCAGVIKSKVLAGRNTFWCASCQS